VYEIIEYTLYNYHTFRLIMRPNSAMPVTMRRYIMISQTLWANSLV